ncbi:MAC/perforin domain-containing protein [Gaoshiqia sp. Z1-71]|uniref:MAC/perforin domain-containing protein n=1 Tax=Gaoshiqia hydrogeniformans TaxID=3290090 RepID=UPI003BF80FC5
MKKIYFLIYVLCITLISSCNNDSLDGTQNDPESYREMQIRSGGDGAYDLLGYGYDITGEYGPTSGKSQVIDLNAFLNTYPDRIETNEPRSSTYEITTGYNSLDLSQKMAINFSSSSTIAFSDEIKLSLASEYSSSTSYQYVSTYAQTFANYGILTKTIDIEADKNVLSNFLTTKFKDDVNSLSPQKVIERYGTHVLAYVKLGGVLNLFYHSKGVENQITISNKAGFQSSFFNTFKVNIGESYDQTLAEKNTFQYMKVKSMGGTQYISSTINFDNEGKASQTISIDKWLQSIDESSSVLIGTDPNKVYPIYDFVPSDKRQAYISAFNEYLTSKRYNIINTAGAIDNYRVVKGLGNSNEGGGVVVADVNKNGKPDIILMGNDNPSKDNAFWYWVKFDVDRDGELGTLSKKFIVPVKYSYTNHGAAITYGDIDNNGKPDLIFMALDKASEFRYVIGYDVNADGSCTRFSSVRTSSGLGSNSDGAGISICNIDANPKPDLILMSYDAPTGPNGFRYKILYNIDSNGIATYESSTRYINGVGSAGEGAGITVGDINKNGKLDLILTAYDAPSGPNTFKYVVAYDIDDKGLPGVISTHATNKGCGNTGEGADAYLYDIDGNGFLDIVFMAIDGSDPNEFRYYIGHDIGYDGVISYFR